MNAMPVTPQIPQELAIQSDQPRVLVRRADAPRNGGRCVVYWMQRAMRILDNPALDVAIGAGNLLGLPVVVFFSVIPNYPNANLRHYHFMAQGLRDVEEDAAERGVGFVVRRHPDNSLEAFLEEVEAALLVGDENPCRALAESAGRAGQSAVLDGGRRRDCAVGSVQSHLCAAAPFSPALEGGTAEVHGGHAEGCSDLSVETVEGAREFFARRGYHGGICEARSYGQAG
jgi:hypothetical protein